MLELRDDGEIKKSKYIQREGIIKWMWQGKDV